MDKEDIGISVLVGVCVILLLFVTITSLAISRIDGKAEGYCEALFYDDSSIAWNGLKGLSDYQIVCETHDRYTLPISEGLQEMSDERDK